MTLSFAETRMNRGDMWMIYVCAFVIFLDELTLEGDQFIDSFSSWCDMCELYSGDTCVPGCR